MRMRIKFIFFGNKKNGRQMVANQIYYQNELVVNGHPICVFWLVRLLNVTSQTELNPKD